MIGIGALCKSEDRLNFSWVQIPAILCMIHNRLRKFHKNYYFKLWYLHCYYTKTGFFHFEDTNISDLVSHYFCVFFYTIMLPRSHTSFSPHFLCDSAGEMYTTAAGVCIIGTHVCTCTPTCISAEMQQQSKTDHMHAWRNSIYLQPKCYLC